MARRVGIPPVVAGEQLQVSYPDVSSAAQPLPPGTPGRAAGKDVGIEDATTLTFLFAADTGGVKDPSPQTLVAKAMEDEAKAFVYGGGDHNYFNGNMPSWADQFGEPYANVVAPFVAIPGNHDGDPDPTVSDSSLTGIETFMATFCTKTPAVPRWDTANEYGRDTQTQPYCDWTLVLQPVTIIGLWSNVPSGGHLYDSQKAFLVTELQAAPAGVPLVVAIHHPPYSVDAHHGGSKTMGDALDAAFAAANRIPELILSGHVHDYQRFTRTLSGKQVTYVVSGNGGYHNLHTLAPDAVVGQPVGGDPTVIYEAGDDKHYGFLAITAGAGRLSVEYVRVDPAASDVETADTFVVAA